MSFLELAKSRFSVRSYCDRPIEPEVLDAILEAGRVAPTACNNQPQRVYVVKSPEVRARLTEVCRYTFDAPVVLVIACDTAREWKNKRVPGYGSGEADASIVATHMMLAAWEAGIGSCWVGAFSPDRVAETLGLPANERVCALMPMGYPAEDAEPFALHTQYRPIEETVTYL